MASVSRIRHGKDDSSGTLANPAVRRAIGRLASRAEADREGNLLAATFVDAALTEQLDTSNRQILYGRRGTGKTHLLRVMEQRLGSRPSEVAIYVNLMRLGATAHAASDAEVERAGAYVRQLLFMVRQAFAQRSGFAFAQASSQLDAFGKVLDEQGLATQEITQETGTDSLVGLDTRLGAKLSPTSAGISSQVSGKLEERQSAKEVHVMKPVEAVDFPAVADALQRLVQAANLTRLTLLLDEWAEVPYEFQPHLAEFIKRVFFSVDGVTVKIGAIQHRCRFGVRLENNAMLGFEETADVFGVTSLDDTAFSYDRGPAEVLTMFAELLYRHVAVELALAAARGDEVAAASTPREGRFKRAVAAMLGRGHASRDDADDVVQLVADEFDKEEWGASFMESAGNAFMRDRLGTDGPEEFVDALFEADAFKELVRAAQGVPRDFMTILNKAVFSPSPPKRLTKTSIRLALDALYGEKLGDLSEAERRMLTCLIKFTTSQDARCLLPDTTLSRDSTFHALVDRRLLHRLRRGLPDPEEPARTFDVYSLDYGSYVGAVADGNLSDSDLTEMTPSAETVEPFADGRRIKRIVVNRSDLS